MKSIREEASFLTSLTKGLAAQLGPHCEVVLHDLKNQPYETTIVAIENGHITGRKVGDGGTNLGLEVLRGTAQEGDQYNYRTQTKEGKILRSTSIYIRSHEGEVLGALCLNLDITDFLMAERALATITNRSAEGQAPVLTKEVFTNDVTDLLDSLIQDSIKMVGKPVAMMTADEKREGIRFLDQKGALLIKKSGERVAAFYGISKYTLYAYLKGQS